MLMTTSDELPHAASSSASPLLRPVLMYRRADLAIGTARMTHGHVRTYSLSLLCHVYKALTISDSFLRGGDATS